MMRFAGLCGVFILALVSCGGCARERPTAGRQAHPQPSPVAAPVPLYPDRSAGQRQYQSTPPAMPSAPNQTYHPVTAPQEPAPGGYIGNQSTMVFHRPTYSYLPAARNRVSIPSREGAISRGYRPCQHCNP